MRKRQTALLMIVICIVGTMMCVAISAQPLAPHTDSGQSVDALADVITKSFSLTDTQANPGLDWCTQIEVDTKENWWYIPDNDNDIDKNQSQSLYGNRVRLIYQSSKDPNVIGFASLFLAFDLQKKKSYAIELNSQNQVNLQKPPQPNLAKECPVSKMPHPPCIPTNLGQIIFPSSHTICPTFAKVLAMLFNDSVYSWQPVGDMNCDDYAGNCPTVLGTDGKPHQIRESFLPGCDPLGDPGNCKFLFWEFNGIDHKISGAIRFMIYVQLIKGGPPQIGYLTIGFGGNGGAG